jgi:hypothetical protein
MSALPPKADIVERDRHVRFVRELFDHVALSDMLPTRVLGPFCELGWPLYNPPKSNGRGRDMEPIKFTLCPNCSECPEVEITDQGVTIGEDENTVRLSHAEWNELVRLIKDGKLREVWRLKTSAAST